MKTLQKFYEEVKASDDLKKSLAEAVKSGKVTEFLKAHDCDATADELKEFVAGKAAQDQPVELSEEELEMVAGGTGGTAYTPQTASCTCDTDCCDKDCC